MLGAALSGLLPPPPPLPSHHPSADGNQAEQPWPSQPPPCPLPLSSSAPNGSNGRGRGGGGFGDHQWDEAFLGLLSAAVWRLPAARISFLAVTAGAAATRYTRRAAGAGQEATATTASAIHGGGGTGAGAGGRASAPGAAGDAAAVTAAVLRRLYHPRPSVRRLAGSIAVRLAFDCPSFFSALGCGGGGGDVLSGGCASSRSQDCGVGGDDDGGGDDGGGMVSLGDGFAVPRMVLEAYPRLVELTGSGGGGGGVDGGDSNDRRATAVYGHDQHDMGGSGSSSTPGTSFSFEHLVSSEWALLLHELASTDDARSEGEEYGQTSQGAREHRHCRAVAPELAGAIGRAGRRSEFAAAMLEARALMLAGSG